jgi:hypothetical protein
MPEQNFDLPQFPGNEPITREELRELSRRLQNLSNDVASRYTRDGSIGAGDRFTISIFPAQVQGVFAQPSQSASDQAPGPNPQSAQYACVRTVTDAGLTSTSLWHSSPDGLQGILPQTQGTVNPQAGIIATNLAELDQNGNPTGNFVQPGQQVLVAALWNRGSVGGISASSPSQNNAPLYMFWFFPTVAWIKIESAQPYYSEGSYSGGGGYYNATLVTGAPVTIDPTTDLVAPISPNETLGTANAILAMNWAEANLGDPASHTVECPTFVPAWLIGYSNETPSRPVYRFYVPLPGPVTLKITGVYGSAIGGGGGARYKAEIQLGNVYRLDTATNYKLADPGTAFPGSANAVWVNVFEGGSGTDGTNVVGVGAAVRGSYVGISSSALPVFYGSSAPTGTTFVVNLSVDGGTSTPNFKYTLTTLGGIALTNATISPDFRQGWQNLTAATAGLAYINGTGVVGLKYADEQLTPTDCG